MRLPHTVGGWTPEGLEDEGEADADSDRVAVTEMEEEALVLGGTGDLVTEAVEVVDRLDDPLTLAAGERERDTLTLALAGGDLVGVTLALAPEDLEAVGVVEALAPADWDAEGVVDTLGLGPTGRLRLGDGEGDTPVHAPYRAWHPVPQYASVDPHHPNWLQHRLAGMQVRPPPAHRTWLCVWIECAAAAE